MVIGEQHYGAMANCELQVITSSLLEKNVVSIVHILIYMLNEDPND